MQNSRHQKATGLTAATTFSFSPNLTGATVLWMHAEGTGTLTVEGKLLPECAAWVPLGDSINLSTAAAIVRIDAPVHAVRVTPTGTASVFFSYGT